MQTKLDRKLQTTPSKTWSIVSYKLGLRTMKGET